MILAASSIPALTGHTRLLAGLLALLFIGVVLELIRRHKLQERYTILWLGTSLLTLAIAIFPGLLALPNSLLGVRTPGFSIIFLVLLALGSVILHLMIVVSQQGERITRIAQELAIQTAHRQDLEAGQSSASSSEPPASLFTDSNNETQ
jgi:hypothetical protein